MKKQIPIVFYSDRPDTKSLCTHKYVHTGTRSASAVSRKRKLIRQNVHYLLRNYDWFTKRYLQNFVDVRKGNTT